MPMEGGRRQVNRNETERWKKEQTPIVCCPNRGRQDWPHLSADMTAYKEPGCCPPRVQPLSLDWPSVNTGEQQWMKQRTCREEVRQDRQGDRWVQSTHFLCPPLPEAARYHHIFQEALNKCTDVLFLFVFSSFHIIYIGCLKESGYPGLREFLWMDAYWPWKKLFYHKCGTQRPEVHLWQMVVTLHEPFPWWGVLLRGGREISQMNILPTRWEEWNVCVVSKVVLMFAHKSRGNPWETLAFLQIKRPVQIRLVRDNIQSQSNGPVVNLGSGLNLNLAVCSPVPGWSSGKCGVFFYTGRQKEHEKGEEEFWKWKGDGEETGDELALLRKGTKSCSRV